MQCKLKIKESRRKVAYKNAKKLSAKGRKTHASSDNSKVAVWEMC